MRAPDRYDVPPSNGTPTIDVEAVRIGDVRKAHERRGLRESRRLKR